MKSFFCFFLLFCLIISSSVQAAFVLQNGRFKDAEKVATLSVEAHYTLASEAFEKKDFIEAAKQFNIVAINFPSSALASESLFFYGVCEYNNAEYEFANEAFSKYLKSQGHPKHFEDAIGYKFAIAEAFRMGAQRHFFSTKQLPKWASGRSFSVQIYDEVICSLPCHEYAAQSLYSKAYMLWQDREWRETIEAYQMLIRRFPKHELTPLAYLCVNRVYLEEAQFEFQNPDLLALAQINQRKFARDFPKDERISEGENVIQAIKEVYALGLYETGQFYERVSHPQASVIYYMSAVKQFPDTKIAELCRKRLSLLSPKAIPDKICLKS